MVETINPETKLTASQIFQLFWFEYSIVRVDRPDFNYLTDFHITDTKIHKFNQYILQTKDDVNYMRQLLIGFPLSHTDICVLMQELDGNFLDNMAVFSAANEYIMRRNEFIDCYDKDYRFAAKPVIWDLMRTYNDFIMQKIEVGAIMETFIEREFEKCGVDIGLYTSKKGQKQGESRAGIEIKYDLRSVETGNFYIQLGETYFNEEKLIDSGIIKRDNTLYWIIGVPEKYYIVSKQSLLSLYNSMSDYGGWQNGLRHISCKHGGSASTGFLVKEEVMKNIAVSTNVADFVRHYMVVAA